MVVRIVALTGRYIFDHMGLTINFTNSRIKSTGSDSDIFKVLGAEISAKDIGGIILAASAVWAYLAYRSRAVYRHK